MAQKIIDEATVTQIETILWDVAQEASALKTMAIDAHDGNRSEETGQHLCIIQTLAEKIGFLADLAIRKIDPLHVRKGDAEDWFLGGRYHDAVKAPEPT